MTSFAQKALMLLLLVTLFTMSCGRADLEEQDTAPRHYASKPEQQGQNIVPATTTATVDPWYGEDDQPTRPGAGLPNFCRGGYEAASRFPEMPYCIRCQQDSQRVEILRCFQAAANYQPQQSCHHDTQQISCQIPSGSLTIDLINPVEKQLISSGPQQLGQISALLGTVMALPDQSNQIAPIMQAAIAYLQRNMADVVLERNIPQHRNALIEVVKRQHFETKRYHYTQENLQKTIETIDYGLNHLAKRRRQGEFNNQDAMLIMRMAANIYPMPGISALFGGAGFFQP